MTKEVKKQLKQAATEPKTTTPVEEPATTTTTNKEENNNNTGEIEIKCEFLLSIERRVFSSRHLFSQTVTNRWKQKFDKSVQQYPG